MEQELKEEFITLFNQYIHREGAQDLLKWLEASDFFYAPASTRFHGSYRCGLLEHSLNVYHCLMDDINCDAALYDNDGNCSVTQETIAIVALLHDVCKINFYKLGTRNVKVDGKWTTKIVYEIDEKFPCGYHADKSVILIQQFMKLTPEEILAIRAHMGAFDSAVKSGERFLNNIFDRSRLAVHLHIADMEASYLVEERSDTTISCG